MSLRWRPFDYVPSEIAPTKSDRRALRVKIKEAKLAIRKDSLSYYQDCWWRIAMAIPLLIAWWFVIKYLKDDYGFGQMYNGFGSVFLTLICIIGVIVIVNFALAPMSRRRLYIKLRFIGYEVCPKCGYWLKELDDSIAVCPECGTERELMPKKILPKPDLS